MPKRKAISVETKLTIINRLNNGEKQSDLAREFDIAKSTIGTFKKNEASLREFVHTAVDLGEGLSRKKIRRCKGDELDKAMRSIHVDIPRQCTSGLSCPMPAYPVPVAVGSIKSVSDPIVVEIFIDPACPYSRKLYLKIKDILDDWTNVQFRVTLVPQPWHPQSPVMCEVLLAAKMYAASKTSDGKPEAMAKAFASGLTENYIHQELIGIDGVTDGRTRFENQKAMAKCIANGDEEMEQGILKCLEPVVPKEGPRHNGNGVSQELKWSVRYHRVRGVHVTPTVFVNGLEMGDIGSSSSVEDWSAKLEGVGAVKA